MLSADNAGTVARMVNSTPDIDVEEATDTGTAWSATLAYDLDDTDTHAPTEQIVLALALVRHRPQSRELQARADEGELDAAARIDTARARYLDTLGWTFDNVTIADVARDIGVDRPRATRLTAQLERDGLVERTKSHDGRGHLVRLTQHGQEVVKQRHAARARSVTTALELAGFSPDEQDTFADMFQRFAYAWLGASS